MTTSTGAEAVQPSHLIEQFFRARRDPALALLEGLHPLKHALRFGAELKTVVTWDESGLQNRLARMAPDLQTSLQARLTIISRSVYDQLSPMPHESGVIAIARRSPAPPPVWQVPDRPSPSIVLEYPSHLGNVGAVIRTAAAAGASGVTVVGPHDPWHPSAIRGAAGLQFALPVGRHDAGPDRWESVIAIHPEGEPLSTASIPDNAVLIFGAESRGLRHETLARAPRRIAIPMERGVSSLNLGAAVAVILYSWRLARASR